MAYINAQSKSMSLMSELYPEILEKITERYDAAVKIGSRCEANTYYRVEDLNEEESQILAECIAERIINVCSNQLPDLLIRMPGTYTKLAEQLAKELAAPGEKLDVLEFDKIDPDNGTGSRLKNSSVLIITDVITTARSCLEAHSQSTMMGATVLCWASIIDRTFGPGPVPVVAAWTGEPVTLLSEVA